VSLEPPLSVVIPTAGAGAGLPRLLASLRSAGPTIDRLIVDNGSSHAGLSELARAYGWRVVVCSEPGLALARAAGVDAARAATVLFLDDDTQWARGDLLAVAEFFERHPRCGCLGLSVANELTLEIRTRWGWMMELVAETSHGSAWRARTGWRGTAIAGAALAVRRAAWVETGCNRTRLRGDYATHPIRGEDLEAQFRMIHHGWQVWAHPHCGVRHYPAQDRFTDDRMVAVAYWSCAGGAAARRLVFPWFAHLVNYGRVIGSAMRMRLSAHRALRRDPRSVVARCRQAMAAGMLDGVLRPDATRRRRTPPQWLLEP
jgi:glycosyltransferase involved in cell wall biosynthesis